MIRRRKQNNNDNNPNIWKEILEELKNMNQNITQMNQSITQKLDMMNDKLDKMNNKLGQIIRITKLHRAELSEYSLFMTFMEDYIEFRRKQGENIKIVKANIGDIETGDDRLRDFVVEVENGERKRVYFMLKTVISKGMVGDILKGFEGVKGEKWMLARFCNSGSIELLTNKGVNVYTYDEYDENNIPSISPPPLYLFPPPF